MSSITQSILSEPGAAQKAFAVLTFWSLNGFVFEQDVVTKTISQMVLQQRHRGFSSDVSWGLFYALQFRLKVNAKATEALATCDDNCIAIQTLDLKREGLLAKAYASKALAEAVKNAEPDGRDWLLLYEAHRQKFVSSTPAFLSQHTLFADMLARDVAFYRPAVPSYAAVIQPGGAPEWVVRGWMKELLPGGGTEGPKEGTEEQMRLPPPVVGQIGQDVQRLRTPPGTPDELVAGLLDIEGTKQPDVGEDDDPGIEY